MPGAATGLAASITNWAARMGRLPERRASAGTATVTVSGASMEYTEACGMAMTTVDALAADHLRPDGMLERLRGGVDAASFGVATLLCNLKNI